MLSSRELSIRVVVALRIDTLSPGWCGSVDLASASVNWRVMCLISGQGTCLSCKPSPWLGACERQLICFFGTWHRCFFSSPSPSLPLSLKINKILKKKISTLRWLKVLEDSFLFSSSHHPNIITNPVFPDSSTVNFSCTFFFFKCSNKVMGPKLIKYCCS